MSDNPPAAPFTVEVTDRAIIARPQVKLMDDDVLKALSQGVDEAAAAHPAIPLVVLDLSRVVLLPSMALGLLVQMETNCREREQKLKLAGVQPPLLQVFAITMLIADSSSRTTLRRRSARRRPSRRRPPFNRRRSLFHSHLTRLPPSSAPRIARTLARAVPRPDPAQSEALFAVVDRQRVFLEKVYARCVELGYPKEHHFRHHASWAVIAQRHLCLAVNEGRPAPPSYRGSVTLRPPPHSAFAPRDVAGDEQVLRRVRGLHDAEPERVIRGEAEAVHALLEAVEEPEMADDDFLHRLRLRRPAPRGRSAGAGGSASRVWCFGACMGPSTPRDRDALAFARRPVWPSA